MRKLALTLIAFLPTAFFSFGQAEVQIDRENSTSINPFGISDFYLVHQIFADAFYMMDLYNVLTQEQMVDILKAVQNGVTAKDLVTVSVRLKDSPNARLVFFSKEHKTTGQTLVMMTNFNRESRRFEEHIHETESVVRWYFIKGDKLVYRNDLFSKTEEKAKKKAEPHKLIDYYLFDDNKENDTSVKHLIDDLLVSEESKTEKLYAYLYLGEYWLMNGDFKKAESAIKLLKTLFEKEQEIPREYALIVDMATTEFELMKRM